MAACASGGTTTTTTPAVKIEAKPGQAVHVTLKNTGTFPKAVMGHNWVLLKADAKVDDYLAAATIVPAEGYQPKAKAADVLAAIPVIGAGQTAEVTFNAPAAGHYPFVCTFPGHYLLGMKGELVVQ